jgi:ubiquitin C-terminal hydrolase
MCCESATVSVNQVLVVLTNTCMYCDTMYTIQGREADGGHYMGWVRQEGDDWLVYDDADVSPCKTEDIMKLNGGGDWHMAYLAFYRYKD